MSDNHEGCGHTEDQHRYLAVVAALAQIGDAFAAMDPMKLVTGKEVASELARLGLDLARDAGLIGVDEV